MKWSELYPEFINSSDSDKKVQFADVGCGYGGLLGKIRNGPASFSVNLCFLDSVSL